MLSFDWPRSLPAAEALVCPWSRQVTRHKEWKTLLVASISLQNIRRRREKIDGKMHGEPLPFHSTVLILNDLCKAFWGADRPNHPVTNSPASVKSHQPDTLKEWRWPAQRALAFKPCRKTVKTRTQFCPKLHRGHDFKLRVNNLIKAF